MNSPQKRPVLSPTPARIKPNGPIDCRAGFREKSHVRDSAYAVLRSAFDHLFYRKGKLDDADGLAMCTLLVASGEIERPA